MKLWPLQVFAALFFANSQVLSALSYRHWTALLLMLQDTTTMTWHVLLAGFAGDFTDAEVQTIHDCLGSGVLFIEDDQEVCLSHRF